MRHRDLYDKRKYPLKRNKRYPNSDVNETSYSKFGSASSIQPVDSPALIHLFSAFSFYLLPLLTRPIYFITGDGIHSKNKFRSFGKFKCHLIYNAIETSFPAYDTDKFIHFFLLSWKN